MSESINQYLQRVAETSIADACKKAQTSELYKTDIAKFLLSLSPMDRVHLIDAINRADREATLEWARILQVKQTKLDLADGTTQVMKNEFQAEGEG